MSAAEALMGARAPGIGVRIDGDDLVLEASAPPPPAVLDLLSRHKAGIVTLLRPADDGWSAPRTGRPCSTSGPGLPSFDGALSWADAEASAFACCLVE